MIRRMLGAAVARASGLRVVALLLGVLGSVVIARLGGADVKGVSSAFAAANALSFLFLNFDLPHQALREARTTGRLSETAPILARAWALVVLAAGVVTVVLLALSQTEPAWLVAGAAACMVSSQAAVAVAGLNGPVVGAWGAVIQQGSIVVVAAALGFAGVLDVGTVNFAILASYLIPVAYYAVHLIRENAPLGGLQLGRVVRLAGSGIPWQLARLPQVLLLKLDTVVVFTVMGAAAAGMYSVGLALAMLCTLVPNQFASSALHKATRDQLSAPGRIVLQALLAGLVFAVLIAAGGWPAIGLLYGAEFLEAYPVMLACLVGACAYGVMQVQSNIIRIRGNARQLWVSNGVGLVVMLIGFVTLIPVLGIVGAGLAFSAGCVATAIVTAVGWRGLFAAR